MILHFFMGDSIWFDGEWEEKERMEQIVISHLNLSQSTHYLIHRIRDNDDPSVVHIWVDDRVGCTSYDNVQPLPCCVSEEQSRRTVWIDPPLKGKDGNTLPYPWNAHYVEYYQIYHKDVTPLYTVKYWESMEMVEMYDPTDLAVARLAYLRSL